jgi:hypothetical protein
MGTQSSRPPFGYALKNSRLALGTVNNIKLVRRIFREYLAGASLQEIDKLSQ